MSKLVSVILTGGKSSRMGYENKSFLKIKDKCFIEILIESLQGKSNDIIINANRDISKYKIFGYKVVSDKIGGYKGPLAGLHSALDLYKNSKEDLWFALFPTDAPIINTGIIDNFISITEKKSKVYICKIDNIIEPMFSFWSSKIFTELNSTRSLSIFCSTSGVDKILAMFLSFGYFSAKNSFSSPSTTVYKFAGSICLCTSNINFKPAYISA